MCYYKNRYYINLKNKLFLFIICIFTLFFTSCETEGQITGEIIEPEQDSYISTNLEGDGDLFGHIGELYYNFLPH